MKPTPIALVVCDSIYMEHGPARRVSLVGIFDRIVAEQFPCRQAQLCVYVAATELRPSTKLMMRIVHAESDKLIVAMQGKPDPRVAPTHIMATYFVFNRVVFPDPGRYYVEFWADDNLIVQRRLELVARGKKEEPK